MRTRAILCGLLLAVSGSVGAGERIVLKASPEISFAPARITIRASIEADADNRAMEIVAESEEFYRSSMIELEGDQAPRTSVFEFRDLPGGTYQISARLLGPSGKSLAYVRRTIDVIASGGER